MCSNMHKNKFLERIHHHDDEPADIAYNLSASYTYARTHIINRPSAFLYIYRRECYSKCIARVCMASISNICLVVFFFFLFSQKNASRSLCQCTRKILDLQRAPPNDMRFYRTYMCAYRSPGYMLRDKHCTI